MSRQVVAAIAIPFGLVLLALSYLWPDAGLTGGGWTKEKSQAHQKVSADLHQMSYAGHNDAPGTKKPPAPGHAGHDHGDTPVSKSELDQQWEKFRTGQSQLDAARTGGVFWAWLMWIAGILFAGGGAAATQLLPPSPQK